MPPDPSASVEVPAEPDRTSRRAVTFPVARHGYEATAVDHVVGDLADQVDDLRAVVAELREREADLLAALDAAEYRADTAEQRAGQVEGQLDAAGRELAAAQAELDAVHGAADHQVATPVDDAGAVAAAAVGEETGRIIEAARHAAVGIGARARQEAERLVDTAREDARRIRAEAEVARLHTVREADDAVAARLLEAADAVQEAQARAEAIVADAFAEAAEVVLRARQEAAATEAAGEGRAAELLAAATAARDELLGDLVRRRKALRRQVEQLEAGRARLRGAYAVVEGALAEATAELDRTPDEARSAARAAAEAVDGGTDPELEAALATLTGAAPAPGEAEDPAGTDAADEADEADEAAAPEEAAAPVAPSSEALDAAEPAEPGSVAGPPDPAAAPADRVDAGPGPAADPVPDPVPTPAPDPASPGDTHPTEPAASTGGRRRRRAPDPVEFEGRWSSAVRVLAPGGEPADGEALRVEPVARRPRSAASASEVFARLRGAADQPSLFDPPEVDDPPADGVDDPEVAWLARRDAAVAPSVRALRRRLKATLADDEDDLLDALGRAGTVPRDAAPLRDAAARRADLAVALAPSLVAAAAAGATLAAVDAAADPSRAEAVELDDVAAALVAEVLEPLEERLDRCFGRYHRTVAGRGAGGEVAEDGTGTAEGATEAGEPETDAVEAARASLVSSIKAAYRARRGVQVTVPTEDAVLRAAHRGLVAALEPGTPLRWIVAAPAPAPSGRRRAGAEPVEAAPAPRDCPSCVAVADVGAGDRFGHGHDLPPVRPGCRCAVAPVSAVVPRRA